ncbi:hypothetical protein [Photobacterium sp. R1]
MFDNVVKILRQKKSKKQDFKVLNEKEIEVIVGGYNRKDHSRGAGRDKPGL